MTAPASETGRLRAIGWTHAWSDGGTGALHENNDPAWPRPIEAPEGARIVDVYVENVVSGQSDGHVTCPRCRGIGSLPTHKGDSPRIHFPQDAANFDGCSACGMLWNCPDSERFTTDPAAATCQSCLRQRAQRERTASVHSCGPNPGGAA